MILRRDHVAAGVIFAFGLGVIAASRDLPLGTLASPGPGLLPMLSVGLMLALALLLLLRAPGSPPFAEIAWPDLPHALRVVAAVAAGALLYEPLGFLLTVSGVLFGLLVAVERKPPVRAALFAAGVAAVAWLLLAKLLKAPLPTGILGPIGILGV